MVGWVGVLVVAGVVRGQEVGERGRWEEVVRQLGDGSFAVREAGQRALAGATPKDRGVLVDLWAASGDPEVRARLLEGLEGIEMRLVEKPAGVSVEVKEGTLEEVARALAAATGEACTAAPARDGAGKGWRFSLSVKDKSLWEVMGLLNAQHGAGLENVGMALRPQAKRFVAYGEKGAVGVLFKAVERKVVQGRQIYVVSYWVGMDPRVGRVEFGVPQMERMVDDAGNELYPGDVQEAFRWPGWVGMRGFGGSYELPVPAKPGKRLGVVKGVVGVKVHIGEQVVEGEGLAAAMEKSVRVSGERVRVERLERAEGKWRAVVQVEALEGRGEEEASGVLWELLDGRGVVVVNTRLKPGRNEVEVVVVGDAVKGRLRACLAVKEVRAGFEVRDLALPG
jgi:hypothetical protein